MQYDILILTDHSGHSAENSVYALASALSAHPDVHIVDIASRGLHENAAFFSGQIEAILSVIPAVPDLTYHQALELFATSTSEAEVTDYDFILLRLPPPIPAELFSALPEYLPGDHIINTPSGITHTSAKSFLAGIPELCPPLRVVNTPEETLDFLGRHPLVLKPFSGYGGAGIIKLTETYAENAQGKRFPHQDFFLHWNPPYLAMQFLARVTEGDKRTIVVNGKVLGSSLRRPAPDQWICNVAQGGSASHSIADAEELEIAAKLSDTLRGYGIVMFGFDTLVGDDGRRVLSEINTMSIGGLKQTRDVDGNPILPQAVDQFVRYLDDVWYGIYPG